MTILDRLSAVPGTYWGSGDGPHSGPFIARVTVTTTKAGAIDLDYEAWTQGAGLQHAELDDRVGVDLVARAVDAKLDHRLQDKSSGAAMPATRARRTRVTEPFNSLIRRAAGAPFRLRCLSLMRRCAGRD